jgi:hypothetical protein
MGSLAKSFFFIVIGVAILVVATSFFNVITGNKKNNKIVVVFENYAGDEKVKLDSGVYKNGYGQSYTITRLRYYIGNIRLIRKDGAIGYSSPEYYIIDDAAPIANSIELNVDNMEGYSSIRFIIGVDSIHNCSGVQTGALDPVNGMFWAWNTGYIFFKMEGQSASSKSTANMLEFHIGGYKEPDNCIREINLNLGINGIKKKSDINSIIKIKTDISKVFNSTNKIDFSQLSAVTDFHNATTIANNYANMFSIQQQ